MQERNPELTRLAAGQTLHMFAPSGMMLVAVHGGIHIRSTTHWLEGHLVQQDIALQEGEAHRVEDARWIAVSAAGPAELACLAPEPGAIPPLALLRTVRSWLAGR